MILESKHSLFLLQNPKSTIPGSVYQREGISSLKGEAQENRAPFGNQAQTGPRKVIQAWPLFSFLRKGVKDRRGIMLVFPEGLENIQEVSGTLLKIKNRGREHVVLFHPWCWLVYSKRRKSISFSSQAPISSLFSVHGDDWWKNGGLNRLHAL